MITQLEAISGKNLSSQVSELGIKRCRRLWGVQGGFDSGEISSITSARKVLSRWMDRERRRRVLTAGRKGSLEGWGTSLDHKMRGHKKKYNNTS